MPQGVSLKKIVGLGAAVVGALSVAAGASGALSVGVSEDRGKGAAFFATMSDVGLTTNRVAVIWDPSHPDAVPAQSGVQSWLPLAQKSGVRIVFDVAPAKPGDLLTPDAASRFATWVGKVAKTFPQIKDYVIGFLSDLGQAYRASGRKKPIMDQFAFHPYPAKNTDPPSVGDKWPNAGLPNLDRIKQAVWDAFHGTAQPTFAEGRRQSFAAKLTFDLDEIGWQVGVLPSLAGLYSGVEPMPTIDEGTQALYYTDVITTAECDPNVQMLSFFLLEDEPLLTRWQSGLERVDGSHRPSYDAVKQTLAQTHGNCLGEPLLWSHTSQVMAPFVRWRMPKRIKTRRTSWHFSAGADEEVTYRAGIFKARTSRRSISRSLSSGRPKPVLAAKGKINARTMSLGLPARRLKPGRYVFAIRMAATMNPARTSLYISRAFTVASHR